MTARLQRPTGLTLVVLIGLGLFGAALRGLLAPPSASAEDPRPQACVVPDHPRLQEFPLTDLADEIRCVVSDLLSNHTTSGAYGPARTELPVELYEFLLDRPVVTAELVTRIGLGAYRFTEQGPGEFWVEDGEGTEGLLSLLSDHAGIRVYSLVGLHRGQIFRVPARAIVLLKLEALPGERPAVRTFLVAFTRLEDRLLAGLVWLLRPLLEGAITRKLTRGFEVTGQLGETIARDPHRILQELPTLPFASEAEAARFATLVKALPPGGPSIER